MIKSAIKYVAPLALLGLSACAAPFNANVSRFQQLPAPQGQSFAIVAGDEELKGGIEFGQYAEMVADEMSAQGYIRADSPATADLLVTLDYDVDKGQERLYSTYDPFYADGFFGFGRNYWRNPYYRRRAFVYGFNDPFMFGPGERVGSVRIFTSELDLKIDRKADDTRLFEGTAQARSRSNKLTYLVPNLIEAMFTGFPGNSGETVKISVAPES